MYLGKMCKNCKTSRARVKGFCLVCYSHERKRIREENEKQTACDG